MAVAISVDKLSKKYANLQALKSLSFQVKEGDCIGLLGPNGAGKSTTIKILTGQLEPSSGKVELLGIDPSKKPKEVHAFMGYVPDHQSIYEDITVEQNIELFREIYKEPKNRTQELIKQMGLLDKKKMKAKTLSRGLKQRLLLARTLVHTPKLLFLDEPTTGLDPSSTDFICQALEKLKRKGVTLFLSTHLMSLAERLCDQVILLNKGEKKEDGSLSEVKKRHSKPYIKIQLLKEGKEQSIQIPFDDNFISTLTKLHKMEKIISVNTISASLEDIFIRLVREE